MNTVTRTEREAILNHACELQAGGTEWEVAIKKLQSQFSISYSRAKSAVAQAL